MQGGVKMKYVLIFIMAVVFFGCGGQPAEVKEPTVIKETIIKEPTIINNEKTIIIEECPKIEPCKKCVKPKPCPAKKKCTPITIYKGYEKLVIGEKEHVYFPDLDLTLEARIDTGATTTSIHAKNIVPFERDGKKWVRFEMVKKDRTLIKVKRPIVKKIKIKRHAEEGQERFVVNMRLNISSFSYFTEVSLTDRSKYKLPILVGRNFLKGNIIVDVSLSNTKAPTKENR
jgi:hypothetical protein